MDDDGKLICIDPLTDKYLNDEQFRANRELLESDLSALGEALASRFNWEDQLIAQLHGTHSHLA